MTTVIRVSNIDGFTAEQLRWIFQCHGAIRDAQVTGSSGLVEFENHESAKCAILFNQGIYYEHVVAVELFETAGMAIQDIGLADKLNQLLDQAEGTRAQLSRMQASIRSAGGVAADSAVDLLSTVIAARDEARRFHIEHLSRAVQEGERQRPRHQSLQDEAGELLALAALGPSQEVRLEALQSRLLPAVGAFMQQVPRMQKELVDLQEHAAGAPPDLSDLHRLHTEWEEALDELHDARHEETKRRPRPEAASNTKRARRLVQEAEGRLRQERTRIWAASAHFPELVAQESLLRLGAFDGGAVQSVLVEREFDQYAGPDGAPEPRMIGDRTTGRHLVFLAEFGTTESGEAMPCVLKEYELDAAGGEWKRLVAEVEALSRLRHPHIAEVQAVFQPKRAPAPVAYIQLPYYSNGDAHAWRSRTAPVLWKRQRVLGDVAKALHHLHAHGFAHGDLKLENILISHTESAHLADFETVREEHREGGSLGTRTRSGRFDPSAAREVATARYVAPEMRASPACARPTAATDAYAYGVCTLLLCCDEVEDVSFGPPPHHELQGFNRGAAAKKGGQHLVMLLDGLLDLGQPPATSVEEALRRRLSAAEVLLHPFLNSEAEHEAARQATAEAEAAQRQLRWEAAERQRLLDEQEEKVRQEEAAVQRENGRIAVANAALAQRSAKVALEAQEAADSAMAMEMQKRQVEQQKRAAEQQLAVLSGSLMVESAKLDKLRREEAERRQKAPVLTLWLELAGPCTTEQAVDSFFRHRQPPNPQAGSVLRIVSAVQVQNPSTLKAFQGCTAFDLDPFKARHAQGDTLLFHGCSQEAATNIQAEGLKMAYAAPGMLGKGLYGAPDPRKSLQYSQKRGGSHGKFMFICRFNLGNGQHGGPQTAHRNSVFDEFCVYTEKQVVVLWMLKVE